jgi:hypothetical protein
VEAKHEANPSHRSPQESPVRSLDAITNKAGTAHSRDNLDAYNIVHPMLLDNLRVATQQERTVQFDGSFWNDATTWDNPGTNVYEPPIQALMQPGADFSACVSLPRFSSDFTSFTTGVASQHPTVENESANITSQPWFATPSPPQESPEEECHGGLGTAMSWESNWQGYMQQLGVPYDNELGF